MEHRNGKRFALAFQIEIWQGQQCLGKFQSKNIGYGGLFFDKYPNVLKKGHFLETRISSLNTIDNEQFRMKALVVHKSRNGIGLMWADNNALFFDCFDNLAKVAA